MTHAGTMTSPTTRQLFGALVALSLSVTAAAPVGAACDYPFVISVKGSISGTFYDTAGTPTKVKCDVWTECRNDTGSYMSMHWDVCPGLDTYGGGVYLNPSQAYRIVKNGEPQKSCVVSNRYTTPDPQGMSVTVVSVLTTFDTESSTTLVKEKGTMNFTRSDGVFTGKFSFKYPTP